LSHRRLLLPPSLLATASLPLPSLPSILPPSSSPFFFFNATATTEIYTLSLHDALPICRLGGLEVLDDHVEVHLLRVILTRPTGRMVVLDLLDADRGAGIGGDLGPCAVSGDGDLRVEELCVEVPECGGVGGREHENGRLCDSHALESTP